MRSASCLREREMAQAVAARTVTQDLRTHAASCEVCLTTWLTMAVPGASPPPAINPAALWDRAGRMRRLRAEAQMSRIVTGAQVIAAILILAVLVFFGSRPATWASLSFTGANATLLATGLGLLVLAGVGVSRLIAQDQGS
jgi:hypothetical protein